VNSKKQKLILAFLPALSFVFSTVWGGESLQGAKAWDTDLYNPKQAEKHDDVILPMPCGGKMAFRRIETPASNQALGLFGDLEIKLGDETATENVYAVRPITTYIAGGFSTTNNGTRYLLMGKYELTQLQYNVVMKNKRTLCPSPDDISTSKDEQINCPAPDKNSNLPKTQVNWFDATEFGKCYSVWLQKNAFTDLPKKDNEPGYVRLPTEAEWEYAARGGQMVSPDIYRQPAFFSEAEADQYARFYKPDAEGGLQAVGLLKSNPLGLHDILGNAEEIVFDLYHLRHQREYAPHGEAGGYVLRGGHYRDKKLSAAKRTEEPFYKDGKLNPGKPTAGFRLVLSAPVTTSANFEQLDAAWQQLQNASVLNQNIKPDTREQVKKQAFETVNTIRETTQDAALKAQMDKLEKELVEQRRAYEDQHQVYEEQLAQAAFEAFRYAGILCQKLSTDGDYLSKSENFCKTIANTQKLDRCSNERLASERKVYDFNTQLYADAIVNLGRYDLSLVKQQRDRWLTLIEANEYKHIKPYPGMVISHVEQLTKSKKLDKKKWTIECESIE